MSKTIEDKTLEKLNEYIESGAYKYSGPVIGKEEVKCCIEALEKQVAKKVTVEGVYDYWGDEVDNEYTCPTCLKEDYVHYRDIKYCWNCGQKLDLSEVE